VSRHHLTTLKCAYLKLRYLLDCGCVFVGHGLKQDFRMLNMVVPPHQVGGSGRPASRRLAQGGRWERGLGRLRWPLAPCRQGAAAGAAGRCHLPGHVHVRDLDVNVAR
jgi:PAB-dependent poly(A)-specific ribonuclease subunit 2